MLIPYINYMINAFVICQAFSVSDTQWSCRINEGAAGISYAAWSPDARHIVTVTEYQLRYGTMPR